MKKLYQIENSIQVHCPTSVVWEVVIRPQKYITYSEKFHFNDETLKLGTWGEVTIGVFFYPVTYRFEVTQFVDGRSCTIEGVTSRGWQGRLSTSLEPITQRLTRLSRTKEYGLPTEVAADLLNTLFFKRRYTKMEMHELRLIKQLAEG